MRSFSHFRPYIHAVLPTLLIFIAAAFAAGQTTGSGEEVPQVNPVYRRIERARALAAVHQLQAAAAELENVRASVNDVALRNGTTLMLLGIYLEDGNYGRSQSLLEETFHNRAAQKDESIRTYFAAAGQTLNGIRTHLARYRNYGINPTDANLPSEAAADLERVRNLLERVIAQAKEISTEAGRSYDALALQEDVLSIRLSLARNTEDHARWQTEYLTAREKMATSQVQVAMLGRSPALDAVTSKIPNPFANQKPTTPAEQSASTTTTAPVTATPGAAPTPTPSTTGPEPQLITTGSLSGRESKRVTPVYPPMAKSHNVGGTVRVFAIVDENGKLWITNSEGPVLLRAAAEEAARGWVFPPSTLGGKPVRLAGYLDFDFKL
ncbi:MAG TPA: energy transducer TonB [Pyrinomonadaceae bacterium]|nr:energy transducer TonB [Pyrinomonadaceae bacterium]